MVKASARSILGAALAVATLMGTQLASAQGLTAGSIIKLDTTPNGTLAGAFKGTVQAGGPGMVGATFLSFCLEKYEYFTPGSNLYVGGVSTATRNSVGSSTTTQISGGASGIDPISAQTAYLFTQFYNNNAAYAGSNALANSFQRAVWFLEDELTGSDLNAYNSDTQAKSWVQAANTAVSTNQWSGLGNVRVLNLYTDAGWKNHSQDQLYMVSSVPEPESLAMMLAGLGLMGSIARRRQRAA